MVWGGGTGTPFINNGNIQYLSEEAGMVWFLLALLWGSIIVKLIYGYKYDKLMIIVLSIFGLISTKFIWLPFSIQQGIAVTFWIYLGIEIKNRRLIDKLIQVNKIWIYLAVILWGISILFGTTHLFANRYGLGIIDILGAISGSLIIFLIANVLDKKTYKLKNILCWIGSNTITIYIIHYLERRIFSVDKIVNLIPISSKLLNLSIQIILICIICCGTAYIYNRYLHKYILNVVKIY